MTVAFQNYQSVIYLKYLSNFFSEKRKFWYLKIINFEMKL